MKARPTRAAAGDLDDLVPRWLFVLRSVPARVVAAVAIPVAFSVPLLAVKDVDDLRLGPFLVLAIVTVAALAGWVATIVAASIVTVAYWWYGVPHSGSFQLSRAGDAIALTAMVALGAGITAMAWRVERTVNDVRALDRQRRRHALAEAAARHETEVAMAQVQAVLGLSNDLARAATMREVGKVALERIDLPVAPTTSSIAIVHGDTLRVLASKGATRASIDALERIDVRTSSWLGQALEGRTVVVDDRERFARDHPDARVLQIYPSGSWAVVPFRSESTIGLLSLYYIDPQPLTRYTQYFSLVGEILATALERAEAEEQQQAQMASLEHAFDERDRIARTLSTTLLPPRLPALAGFTAAGWLIPARSDEVAGDFYDLFSVGDGDWVAVLGDVCGKGAEAAAVTSLARYAARVTALDDPHPAHIADVANQALVEDPSDLFCTMGIVRYRQADGQMDVTLSGHLQVRVIQHGQVTRVGSFGCALGYATAPAGSSCWPLAPGSTMVLFSDGLVERDPGFGEDDLDALLAGAPPGPAAAVADYVRAHVLAVPPTRQDDLALLVICRDT